jgi:hypothetical protein
VWVQLSLVIATTAKSRKTSPLLPLHLPLLTPKPLPPLHRLLLLLLLRQRLLLPPLPTLRLQQTAKLRHLPVLQQRLHLPPLPTPNDLPLFFPSLLFPY